MHKSKSRGCSKSPTVLDHAPLKQAVVFGTGKMACGLLGELLYESGYQTLFIARKQNIINAINKSGGYYVGIAGATDHWVMVRDCHAVPIEDSTSITNAIVTADVAFTAVGIDNIPAIAPLLAEGLRCRMESNRKPVNVIASENLPGTGCYLRHQIIGAASLQSAMTIDHLVGFSAALTHRIMTGGEIIDGELHYVVDVPGDLIIDSRGLINPPPTLYHTSVSTEFDALYLEKLSTINLAQAVASYLGHLYGCQYVHEAVLHPAIAPVVRGASNEAIAAFKAEFPHLSPTIEYDAQEALERITDKGLGDTVKRICKGPQRKLTSQERLLGPARLAVRHNLPYNNLALAIAAALAYCDALDPQSKMMQYIIANEGIDKVLTDVCGLLPHEPLAQHIKSRWTELVSEEIQAINAIETDQQDDSASEGDGYDVQKSQDKAHIYHINLIKMRKMSCDKNRNI